jgi:hypothetical protein
MNQEGVLCTNPADIDDAWLAHYQALARDVIGFSQNPEHWEDIIPDALPGSPQVSPDNQAKLNGNITWQEVMVVLKRLKSWKAPGGDRIPVDFLKVFVTDEEEANPAILALTRVCNRMFCEGKLPAVWTTAVVVSIFKKGDPTDCGNYRGISLIDSTLKVLLSILTTRLQTVLEDSGMVVKEQAGFRPREECMGQVTALYEVLRRRFLNKTDTHVLFLDFQKAYDVVPHEALFRHLKVLGISGTFMVFLRNLYKDSRVAVRGTDGSTGIAFALERGLRQGCPLSPILFTVFINTIFSGMNNPGCNIPGLEERICGLMFADDTVGLGGDIDELHLILQQVLRWSERHGMTFGVKKCAVMAFKWNDPLSRNEAVFADKTMWHIGGVNIPTPEEYVYLGIKFNLKMLHVKDDFMQHMVDGQLRKGRQAVHDLTPFLACSSVPQNIKTSVLRCVIQAKMLWGAELWGMSHKRVNMVQGVMNNAMRLILGVNGPRAFMPIACMMQELGLQPIWAMVSSRRIRAFYKFPSLNTWAAALVTSRPRFPKPNHLKRTWVTQGMWWIHRMKIPIHDGVGHIHPDRLPPGWFVKGVVNATRKHITARWYARVSNTTAYGTAYQLAKFEKLLPAGVLFPPDFGRGMCLIQQFRANGYWTGQRLERVDPTITSCRFCGANKQETRGHILAECAAWAQYRERYIGAELVSWRGRLGLAPAGELTHGDLERLTQVTLGGESNGIRATHYYPSSDLYSDKEAAKARVKDTETPEPGPVDYASPIQAEVPEEHRPPRVARVAQVVLFDYLPEEDQDRFIQAEGTPELSPPEVVQGNGRARARARRRARKKDRPAEDVARDLRRDFANEDINDPNRPLWARCAMLGVAAFLTQVDRKRVERHKELRMADAAELLDEGLGQDG